MISAVLFDKDGTLFDFQVSWSGWARAFLSELAGDDAPRAAELGGRIGFDWAQGVFHPDSCVIAGTDSDIIAAALQDSGLREPSRAAVAVSERPKTRIVDLSDGAEPDESEFGVYGRVAATALVALVTVLGVGMAALPAGILASGLADHLHRRRDHLRTQFRLALEDGKIDLSEGRKIEQLRRELARSPCGARSRARSSSITIDEIWSRRRSPRYGRRWRRR